MDNNLINSIIENGRYTIERTPDHHLPLSFRNNLLYEIRDKRIIGRISILCALKVYPLWKNFIPDDSNIINLLQKAENYTNTQKDEDDLLKKASKMQTYVTDKNDEEHFSALYAGYSAVNAAYEVTEKDISELTYNDLDLDSYDWDSAFYACLAYNGGASSLQNIDRNKTEEFWKWYLDECVRKAISNEKLVFVKNEVKSQNKEFNRNSVKLLLNEQNIDIKLNKIQDFLISNTPINNWDKIYLTSYIVSNTRMTDVYYYVESIQMNMSLSYDVRREISNLIFSIKDEVYKLTDGEGTFYFFNLVINKDKDKNVQFFYDTQDKSLEKFFNDSDFAEDFKKYPRKIEYTPDWLQKILKREKVDINGFKWD